MPSFVDSFWGEDICSTDGFDEVCNQLHNGRLLCKTIEDFLKQRSRIEEEYGKALLKLANSSTHQFSLDESSLLVSWRSLRIQTEELANSHLKLSKAFSEQQARLGNLLAEQKRIRKPTEDEIRKLQQSKRDASRKCIESKKNYYKRCKESDLLDKLVQGTTTLKEKDKLVAKQQKAKSMADSSDKLYAESVEALNVITNDWEVRMTDYLVTAEELETNRILALRNEMWEHWNFVSITCVFDDECCEKARKSLEACNESIDLRDFILQHSTGSTKPEYAVYENYYSNPASHDI